MREITINRRSWHWWFANLGDGANLADLCAYIRSVIGGIVMCIFVAFVVLIVGALAGTTVGWFLAWLFVGFTEPTDLALPGLIVAGIGIGFGVFYFPIKGAKSVAKNSEFVQAAYISLKDRVCFKVRVE